MIKKGCFHSRTPKKSINTEQKKKLQKLEAISLLNCDYKLLAKVLSNRIIDIIPKLIDQTGNIKERFMVKISELFQTLSHIQI